MSHTPDAAAAGNGGTFDPQQAATMLDQATRQARREFTPSPPWLLVTRGVLVLAALGGIWLTVRGQHPYRGPTAADIPVLAGFVVINFFATVTVRERAMSGVRGRSRLRPAEIATLVAAVAVVPAVMVALHAAGASFAWYPTTVMVVPGLAWAGISAARRQWQPCGVGLAVALVGVVGAFAGSAGSWLVAGVGLCLVLVGDAATTAWRQRA